MLKVRERRDGGGVERLRDGQEDLQDAPRRTPRSVQRVQASVQPRGQCKYM